MTEKDELLKECELIILYATVLTMMGYGNVKFTLEKGEKNENHGV